MLLRYTCETSLADYTVLLPSCGVGNVAQLTIDLLIATLRMDRSATGWHRAIVPIIGPAAYEHIGETLPATKTTACELYTSAAHKLAVFQMRSPLVAALMSDFFAQLISHLRQQNVRRLIVLTSSHAYEKHFVSTTPFEYMCNEHIGDIELDRKHWLPIERRLIFGGGYANALFAAATDSKLPAAILFKYVSEGDNTPDAIKLLARLNAWLGIWPEAAAAAVESSEESITSAAPSKIRLVIPSSWKFLYGDAPPDHIY